MCLVVFAWKTHPDYPLIVAANRDERHDRPSRDAAWWPDNPDLLAGRDLQAGGTWLAVARSGRFATVTNYREAQQPRPGLRSRGEIVTGFVAGDAPAPDFIASLPGEEYAGVSVLAGDGETLCYASNRGDAPRSLAPGVYGLSNASLDTPWPKLLRARNGLSDLIAAGDVDPTALMRLLADRAPAPAADVDSGELPFRIARALTAPFIVTETYGTRCSTTLMTGSDGRVRFRERRFGADGSRSGESSFDFVVAGGAVRRR